jgi:hypothetical protein
MVNAAVNVKKFKLIGEDKELRSTAFIFASMSEGQTVVCSGAVLTCNDRVRVD